MSLQLVLHNQTENSFSDWPIKRSIRLQIKLLVGEMVCTALAQLDTKSNNKSGENACVYKTLMSFYLQSCGECIPMYVTAWFLLRVFRVYCRKSSTGTTCFHWMLVYTFNLYLTQVVAQKNRSCKSDPYAWVLNFLETSCSFSAKKKCISWVVCSKKPYLA